MAAVVNGLGPTSLYSSDEPKAAETAGIVGGRIDLPVKVVPGLQEHIRTGVPFATTIDRDAAVIDSIRRPDQLVYGSETTGTAERRFTTALEGALTDAPAGDAAVVSHGTVISMFVAKLTGLDAVDIWSSFGLPGFVVVRWPEADGIEFQWNYGEGD